MGLRFMFSCSIGIASTLWYTRSNSTGFHSSTIIILFMIITTTKTYNFVHFLVTEYWVFVLLVWKTLPNDYVIPFSLTIIDLRMGTWPILSRETWNFGNGFLDPKMKSQEYRVLAFLLDTVCLDEIHGGTTVFLPLREASLG